KEESVEFKDESFDEFSDIKQEESVLNVSIRNTDSSHLPILSGCLRMCYLCGAMINHCYATPADPVERSAFLSNVITSKKSDVQSIRALGRNMMTAHFCLGHLRTSTDIPKEKQVMPSEVFQTSLPLDQSTSMEIPSNNIAQSSLACSECGKKFARQQTLNNHMLIHSGEKPFTCEYCELHFRSKSYRYTHLRNFHKIKLYSCLTCGEQFDLKAQLNKHQFIHKENILKNVNLGDRVKGVLASPSIIKAIDKREKIEDANKPSKVEWIWSKQYFKCTLCGDNKLPTTASPKGPIRARKFFDNLVKLTEKEREKMEFVINNKIRADVCQKHFILTHYSE
ncbi:hypothetical protein PMAYCL1PPCAC_01523, partial [Pristionchus mayeri]